jgi:MATE family multidrug resistance protein
MTIALAAGFMAVAALTLLLWPGLIVGAFTKNTDVISRASQLLFAAAAFQIFDGVQVTTTGVLRGAGNTKTPMFVNLVAHWLLGLPAGYYLCFFAGLGVVGIWLGLSAGLIVVACLLLFFWSRTRV